MKTLPANATAYKRTAEFTEATVPSALLRSHRTKEGAWAKIVVLEGALTYRILEPTVEEVMLTPDRHGRTPLNANTLGGMRNQGNAW